MHISLILFFPIRPRISRQFSEPVEPKMSCKCLLLFFLVISSLLPSPSDALFITPNNPICNALRKLTRSEEDPLSIDRNLIKPKCNLRSLCWFCESREEEEKKELSSLSEEFQRNHEWNVAEGVGGGGGGEGPLLMPPFHHRNHRLLYGEPQRSTSSPQGPWDVR